MADIVPLEPNNANQEFSLELDGATYVLKVQWQDRDESWYLDLLTEALEPVLMGARIAVGVPLLFQCKSALRPAGELIADAKDDVDPGLDDFGEGLRCQLGYLSAADVAEALA